MSRSGRLALVVTGLAIVGLLTGILVLLNQVRRDGVTVHHTGEVTLASPSTDVSGTVQLEMPDPVNLIATGPDRGAIPAQLSAAVCPSCGGQLLPVQWNPWNGNVTWKCVDCGYVPPSGQRADP